MRTSLSQQPSDVDDGPEHDDPVVLLLEVTIGLVFASVLGLALLWIG
ncbi:hypothetical protein ACTJKO_10915 [Curtobacterium sp. 22159]